MLQILEQSPEAGTWPDVDFREPRRCWVAERGGQVVGFLLAQCPIPEEAEILALAVDPHVRRSGVAATLLRAFLEGRSGRVWLEVRASNTAARRLYEGLGFVAGGVREGYYIAPPEDAIVMELSCFQ